jgi:hypothetical protein
MVNDAVALDISGRLLGSLELPMAPNAVTEATVCEIIEFNVAETVEVLHTPPFGALKDFQQVEISFVANVRAAEDILRAIFESTDLPVTSNDVSATDIDAVVDLAFEGDLVQLQSVSIESVREFGMKINVPEDTVTDLMEQLVKFQIERMPIGSNQVDHLFDPELIAEETIMISLESVFGSKLSITNFSMQDARACVDRKMTASLFQQMLDEELLPICPNDVDPSFADRVVEEIAKENAVDSVVTTQCYDALVDFLLRDPLAFVNDRTAEDLLRRVFDADSVPVCYNRANSDLIDEVVGTEGIDDSADCIAASQHLECLSRFSPKDPRVFFDEGRAARLLHDFRHDNHLPICPNTVDPEMADKLIPDDLLTVCFKWISVVRSPEPLSTFAVRDPACFVNEQKIYSMLEGLFDAVPIPVVGNFACKAAVDEIVAQGIIGDSVDMLAAMDCLGPLEQFSPRDPTSFVQIGLVDSILDDILGQVRIQTCPNVVDQSIVDELAPDDDFVDVRESVVSARCLSCLSEFSPIDIPLSFEERVVDAILDRFCHDIQIPLCSNSVGQRLIDELVPEHVIDDSVDSLSPGRCTKPLWNFVILDSSCVATERVVQSLRERLFDEIQPPIIPNAVSQDILDELVPRQGVEVSVKLLVTPIHSRFLSHFSLSDPQAFFSRGVFDSFRQRFFDGNPLPLCPNTVDQSSIDEMISGETICSCEEIVADSGFRFESLIIFSIPNIRLFANEATVGTLFQKLLDERPLPICQNTLDPSVVDELVSQDVFTESFDYLFAGQWPDCLISFAIRDADSFLYPQITNSLSEQLWSECGVPLVPNVASAADITEILATRAFDTLDDLCQIRIDQLSVPPKSAEVYVNERFSADVVASVLNDWPIFAVSEIPIVDKRSPTLFHYQIQGTYFVDDDVVDKLLTNLLQMVPLPIGPNDVKPSEIDLILGDDHISDTRIELREFHFPYVHPTERRIHFPFPLSGSEFLPDTLPIGSNTVDDSLAAAIVSDVDSNVLNNIQIGSLQTLANYEPHPDLLPIQLDVTRGETHEVIAGLWDMAAADESLVQFSLSKLTEFQVRDVPILQRVQPPSLDCREAAADIIVRMYGSDDSSEPDFPFEFAATVRSQHRPLPRTQSESDPPDDEIDFGDDVKLLSLKKQSPTRTFQTEGELDLSSDALSESASDEQESEESDADHF